MSEPDLTPQERQVRALLAQARHDEPVPDDVAARLDRALADLRAESPAPVADLAAARRRRHRIRTGLVAAAAAVVLGVGVTQIDLTGLQGSDSADSGAADSAAESEIREPAPESGAAPAPDEAPADGGAATLTRQVVVLDSADFEAQVRRLVRDNGRLTGPGYHAYLDQRSTDAAASTCAAPPPGPGSWIPVEYDGAPAVLVLRPPSGGVRVADLYLCGDTTPTRSAEAPVS